MKQSSDETDQALSGEIMCHTALRGLAAICVVFYHCSLFSVEHTGSLSEFAAIFQYGFICVDLFFILSGFILYYKNRSIFRSSIEIKRNYFPFLIKRLIRIYPNYIVWFLIAVIATVAVSLYRTGGVEVDKTETIAFLMHVAMVQSLLIAPFFWNVPLWSIAVEIIAYICLPMIAGLRKKAPVVFDIAVGCLALLGLIVLFMVYGSVDVITGMPSVIRCLSGFCIGVILAAYRDWIIFWPKTSLAIVQVIGFFAAVTAVVTGFEPLALPGFMLLVLSGSINRGPVFEILRLRPFHFLGQISFSIYLAHIPVLHLYTASMGKLENMIGVPFLESFVLLSVIVALTTIIAATCSYKLLEVPSQAWLKRQLIG